MPQFIRHHASHYTHLTWTLPILAGVLVGCLLAFIASHYLKEMRSSSSAATAPFAVSAAPESKPAPEIKKPTRYEAIKSNWAKHRSENQPKQ